MKIGLVGPTNDETVTQYDAQRTINMYPVFDKEGKEVSALYQVPGYEKSIWDIPDPDIKLLFSLENGRTFVVNGFDLLELIHPGQSPVVGKTFGGGQKSLNFVTENIILRGSFSQGVISAPDPIRLSATGFTWVEEKDSFFICNGSDVYRYVINNNIEAFGYTDHFMYGLGTELLANEENFSGNWFEYGVSSVSFMNGRVLISERNSRVFRYSNLWTGQPVDVTNSIGIGPVFPVEYFDPLSYYTKESKQDEVTMVSNVGGFLWVFGETSIEVWGSNNSGDDPFSKVSGGVIEVGSSAIYTVVDIGGAVIFVGRDEKGANAVYLSQGATYNRISNNSIEKRISKITDWKGITAFAYRQDQAYFYAIQSDELETDLYYEVNSKQWHERVRINEFGDFVPTGIKFHTYTYQKHLVADKNGVYELSKDIYEFNGSPIVRERVFTHISDERKRIRYSKLRIDLQSGEGPQNGNGSTPKLYLSQSRDAGKVWSQWVDGSIGGAGNYGRYVEFRRLGVQSQMTFKVRVSDPIPCALIGAYLE